MYRKNMHREKKKTMPRKKKMIAKDVFKVGDRVRLNAAWDYWNKAHQPVCRYRRAGVVVGFSKNPSEIRVKQYGLKTASVWSAEFWEKIPDEVLKISDEKIESRSSVSQGKTATGIPSGVAEKAVSIKIRPNQASDAHIDPLEPLERPATHEVSFPTSVRLSGAWQRLKNFVRGCKLKLPGVRT